MCRERYQNPTATARRKTGKATPKNEVGAVHPGKKIKIKQTSIPREYRKRKSGSFDGNSSTDSKASRNMELRIKICTSSNGKMVASETVDKTPEYTCTIHSDIGERGTPAKTTAHRTTKADSQRRWGRNPEYKKINPTPKIRIPPEARKRRSTDEEKKAVCNAKIGMRKQNISRRSKEEEAIHHCNPAMRTTNAKKRYAQAESIFPEPRVSCGGHALARRDRTAAEGRIRSRISAPADPDFDREYVNCKGAITNRKVTPARKRNSDNPEGFCSQTRDQSIREAWDV